MMMLALYPFFLAICCSFKASKQAMSGKEKLSLSMGNLIVRRSACYGPIR
jgi:hypothetical protein